MHPWPRAPPSLLAAFVFFLAGCVAEDEAPATADGDGDGFSDAVEARFGSDPRDNASMPEVGKAEPVSFDESVNVVGTGVPSVQCPADAVNSQILTWTVAAATGNATRAWVSDLVFEVSAAATVNDVDLFVTGPDGKELGAATGSTSSESIAVRGERPLGDYQIEVRGCSGSGEATVVASGTVHWIPSEAELLSEP